MSRDELLGRARRAVLAVVGRGDSPPRSASDAARPRPAPTPGLPPRLGEEPQPGLPPRIEREPKAGLPPRIEREPKAGLPPRIEREPQSGLPPRIEREPNPVAPPRIEREPYVPKHVRLPEPAVEPEADPDEPVQAEPDEPVQAEPDEPVQAEPVTAAVAASASAPQAPMVAAPVREAPPPPRRAEPARSPQRAALRSHMWLIAIVLSALVVGASGYWALRVHQRIGETSLEHQIAAREHAPTVKCKKLQSNGAAWACAVVYKVESVCLIGRVNVLGSWSTIVGHNRCAREPALAALRPTTITAAAVATDIDRQLGPAQTVCTKIKGHKVRWACQRPGVGDACLIVRVVPWVPWNEVTESRDVCAHLPALQAKVRAAA